MKLRFFLITLYTLITIGVFNLSYGKSTNFNYNAKNVSNYFSALISFDDYDHLKSQEFFEKIKDSKRYESSHSSSYIQSLISLQKYMEAERYSRNLENKKTRDIRTEKNINQKKILLVIHPIILLANDLI